MKTFNYTTHSKQVLGDMHTPVSIYLKVRDMYPQSALMESSDYHAGENSLSFIGHRRPGQGRGRLGALVPA